MKAKFKVGQVVVSRRRFGNVFLHKISSVEKNAGGPLYTMESGTCVLEYELRAQTKREAGR